MPVICLNRLIVVIVIVLTLLQNSDEILELSALDGEEVVDDESPSLLVPPDPEVDPLRSGIEEVNHLQTRDYLNSSCFDYQLQR